MKYYDPDVIYDSLHRLDLLPKSMEKKGLSRMLKRTLDIDSIRERSGLEQKECMLSAHQNWTVIVNGMLML